MKATESIETIIHRLEVAIREAKELPIVRINSDAIVVEYNEVATGFKRFERITDIR